MFGIVVPYLWDQNSDFPFFFWDELSWEIGVYSGGIFNLNTAERDRKYKPLQSVLATMVKKRDEAMVEKKRWNNGNKEKGKDETTVWWWCSVENN